MKDKCFVCGAHVNSAVCPQCGSLQTEETPENQRRPRRIKLKWGEGQPLLEWVGWVPGRNYWRRNTPWF
jgi:hypothetical protein